MTSFTDVHLSSFFFKCFIALSLGFGVQAQLRTLRCMSSPSQANTMRPRTHSVITHLNSTFQSHAAASTYDIAESDRWVFVSLFNTAQ